MAASLLSGAGTLTHHSSRKSKRESIKAVLEETIAPNQIQRQACWLESLAVGSIGFVERIQPLILSRRRLFRRHQTQNRPCRKLFVTIGEFFFRTL